MISGCQTTDQSLIVFHFLADVWSVQISEEIMKQLVTNTGQHMIYFLCTTSTNHICNIL